jgi:hypothetical protein
MWRAWYEDEMTGEDCDDSGGDPRPCQDVYVRGPGFATEHDCQAWVASYDQRESGAQVGDAECLREGQTLKEHPL